MNVSRDLMGKSTIPQGESARFERIGRLFVAIAQEMTHVLGMQPLKLSGESVGEPVPKAIAAWASELLGRGCTPGSIARLTRTIERAQEHCGWATVADMQFSDVTEWLGEMRRNGWAGPTYDQAVSSLKTFGEFCRSAKYIQANPFADLKACNEPNDSGACAMTVEQAQAFLLAGIIRHQKSKRARGSGPLFWLVMFHTGLRYSEACSLRWENIEGLDSIRAPKETERARIEWPCIWTDPKWRGNKGGRRERIVLSPTLIRLLPQWQAMTGKAGVVLPKPPTSDVWAIDRETIGMPEVNARNEYCSPHSCRKSFGTWLAAAGVEESLIVRMLRHAPSMTRKRYIKLPEDVELRQEVEAIRLLPNLWPGESPSFAAAARFSLWESKRKLADGRGIADTRSASPHPMKHFPDNSTGSPASSLGAVDSQLRATAPGEPVVLSGNAEPRAVVSSSLDSSRSMAPSQMTDRGNGQVQTESIEARALESLIQATNTISAWLQQRSLAHDDR